MLVAPAILLSWKIDPFGMAKLVAHEVQRESVCGSGQTRKKGVSVSTRRFGVDEGARRVGIH